MEPIKIWAHEIKEDLLPSVCMVCGKVTYHRDRRTYRWLELSRLFSGGVGTGTYTGSIPICPQHLHITLTWKLLRKLFAYIIIPLLLAAVIVCGLLVHLDDKIRFQEVVATVAIATLSIITLVVSSFMAILERFSN